MAPSPLKCVSDLTITFLVDNTIEWMTKLPPGFSHEILHHIHNTPVDEELGVPVLDFNDFCCGAHGFSALIETAVGREDGSESPKESEEEDVKTLPVKHLTLFDTGPDSMSLVRNLRSLQIPVTDIERVVTSHWHSDQTGGLLSFLKLRNECAEKGSPIPERNIPSSTRTPGNADSTWESNHPLKVSPCIVDVHPSRPIYRGIASSTTHSVISALPRDPSFEEITALGGQLEKHDKGHTIAGDTVYISGEIPRITDFEGGLLSGVRWVKDKDGLNGKWEPEPHLMDERYGVIDVEGKGLVIFSSCSHAGIVNVVKDAVKTFKRPVHMMIGGLHLAPADLYYRIDPTVGFLSKALRPAPTYVLPMHCTGWKAKIALEKELGEGVVPAGVGHKVEIHGSKDDDERLWVEMDGEN